MTDDNGNKNKARMTKWAPKRWELWHTECVLLSSAGLSNEELSKKFGKSCQQISNILNTPQAAVLRKHALDNLMERQMGGINDRLEALAVKSLDRVHELIFDDRHFEESPLGVVDRAIKVLHGTKKLERESGEGVVNKIDKALVLNTTESTELLESLTKAEKVKQLHEGEVDYDKDVIAE